MSTSKARGLTTPSHQMIRFPTFHDTPTCAQAKTAASSLREILARCTTDRNGDTVKSNSSSIVSSANSSPSPTRDPKKSNTR
jgi:hypothetical protein